MSWITRFFPSITSFITGGWFTPVIYVLAIAFLFGYGYYRGYEHEKAAYSGFVARTEAITSIQQAKNVSVKKASDKATKDTALAYNDAILRLRKYYAKPLVLPSQYSAGSVQLSSSGSQVPGLPETTTTVDATSPNTQPTVTVGECAETTLMLESLQDWILKQEEAHAD